MTDIEPPGPCVCPASFEPHDLRKINTELQLVWIHVYLMMHLTQNERMSRPGNIDVEATSNYRQLPLQPAQGISRDAPTPTVRSAASTNMPTAATEPSAAAGAATTAASLLHMTALTAHATTLTATAGIATTAATAVTAARLCVCCTGRARAAAPSAETRGARLHGLHNDGEVGHGVGHEVRGLLAERTEVFQPLVKQCPCVFVARGEVRQHRYLQK